MKLLRRFGLALKSFIQAMSSIYCVNIQNVNIPNLNIVLYGFGIIR